MELDDDDVPPQLVPAGAGDGDAGVTEDLEELKIKKVPITIVTGM